jgi:hypothetical protein
MEQLKIKKAKFKMKTVKTLRPFLIFNFAFLIYIVASQK